MQTDLLTMHAPVRIRWASKPEADSLLGVGRKALVASPKSISPGGMQHPPSQVIGTHNQSAPQGS